MCKWGNELPLFIAVHNDTKKSLCRLAFIQKAKEILILISKGGMVGILLLYVFFMKHVWQGRHTVSQHFWYLSLNCFLAVC